MRPLRSAFTLFEIVVTIVVASMLILGSFKAMHALYLRSAKARALTELSLRTQISLDQLATLLAQRIPNSTIGYAPADDNCTALSDATTAYPVLEWLARDEAGLTSGGYDGFVDMNRSQRPVLVTGEINTSHLASADAYDLIFAGTFDGGETSAQACEGAYGWHGHDHNDSYPVDAFGDDNITLQTPLPDSMAIYEKYYLTLQAHAVTRLSEVDASADCIHDLNTSFGGSLTGDALLLFGGYRPAMGETFCADPNGSSPEGNVSVLTLESTAFEASTYNRALTLKLESQRAIRGSVPVHITKHKAVF